MIVNKSIKRIENHISVLNKEAEMNEYVHSFQNDIFKRIGKNYHKKVAGGSGCEYDIKNEGNNEEETLIHCALVKYYDSNDLKYPDWLGAKLKQKSTNKTSIKEMKKNSQSENITTKPEEIKEIKNREANYKHRTSNLQALYNHSRFLDANNDSYLNKKKSIDVERSLSFSKRLRDRMLKKPNMLSKK